MYHFCLLAVGLWWAQLVLGQKIKKNLTSGVFMVYCSFLKKFYKLVV